MKKVTKKAKSNNFVVYASADETLVTTEAMEKKMLKEYMFGEPTDNPATDKSERYISDYDRYVIPAAEVAVMISVRAHISVDNGRVENSLPVRLQNALNYKPRQAIAK